MLEHAPALGAPRPGKLGDLTDPAFLEDPYPTFRRLLTEGPVLHDDEHNLWLVAGHAEVLQALGHPAASVATAGARIGPALGEQAARFAPLVAAVSHFLTRLDPPDHTRLRALLGKAFTHEAVERMHDTVAALVEEHLGPRVGRGELDLVAELAVPLPMTVICRMLGIPPEAQPRIKQWSDDLGSIADNDPKIEVLERAQQSLGEMREYVLRVIEERRRRPGSDLLSALIAVEDAGDRLSPDELFGTVQVLLIAGQWLLEGLPRLALKPGVPARRRRNFSLRGFDSFWITC